MSSYYESIFVKQLCVSGVSYYLKYFSNDQ